MLLGGRKIGVRLIIAFGVVLALMVVMMFMGLYNLGGNQKIAKLLFLALGAVTLVPGIVMPVLIERSIVGPLTEGIRLADEIVGNLSVRVKVHSQDETGHLLEALNKMVNSFGLRIAAIRDFLKTGPVRRLPKTGINSCCGHTDGKWVEDNLYK